MGDRIDHLQHAVDLLRRRVQDQEKHIADLTKQTNELWKAIGDIRDCMASGIGSLKVSAELSESFISWLDARMMAIEHNPGIIPLDVWFAGKTQPSGAMMADMQRRMRLSFGFEPEEEVSPKD